MPNFHHSVTILANGSFPKHKTPLKILNNSKTIICCDGAADILIQKNILPNMIIGDMDSISQRILKKYNSICLKIENDATGETWRYGTLRVDAQPDGRR